LLPLADGDKASWGEIRGWDQKSGEGVLVEKRRVGSCLDESSVGMQAGGGEKEASRKAGISRVGETTSGARRDISEWAN